MLNTKKWRCSEHKNDICDTCNRYSPLTDTCDTPTTECVIDDKRQPYDACGSKTLQETIDFYGDNFDYIGSGYEYFINCIRNLSTKKLHFFVYKNIKNDRRRKLDKINSLYSK